MALVTALFVFTTTALGETLLQTVGETRFVADCKVNPVKLVGHVKTTLAPARMMVSGGGGGNKRPNTVPWPELPPPAAVPYRVLPDKINPAYGFAPSLLVAAPPDGVVKLCKFVKCVPSVLTLNTVPLPEVPPYAAVPYRVLPEKVKPASG